MTHETKFGLSLTVNIGLGLVIVSLLLFWHARGKLEADRGPLVVLQRDTAVHCFSQRKTLFTLPKGLLLQDVSARGMDIFEPHRYKLVIPTDDSSLVKPAKRKAAFTRAGGAKPGPCGASYFYSAMTPDPREG
jgi:hypothetical protein